MKEQRVNIYNTYNESNINENKDLRDSTYIKHQIYDYKRNKEYWQEYNRGFRRFNNEGYEWNQDWQDYCECISDEYN